MYGYFEVIVKVTHAGGKDEDYYVVFGEDNEVYIEVLLVEWVEVRALGVRCGSDIKHILLCLGECESAAFAYAFVYFGELFNWSSVDLGDGVLLLGFDLCSLADRDELQGYDCVRETNKINKKKMKEVAHKFNSTVLISFISLNWKMNELKRG